MSVSHVAYGLRLVANVAIPGLSPRLSSDAFDVRIWLKDWTQFPFPLQESVQDIYGGLEEAASDQPNLRVSLLPGGAYFGFFYSDGVRFAVERAGHEVWGDWPENYKVEDACTYLLGPVIGFLLRLRGVTCLHASAVAVDEQAIALVGCPGAGKSTLAAAFASSGFSVLADDMVALLEEGENFLAHPGYPRVNLWPDSVRTLFGSEEALPRITPTWEKRYMALDHDSIPFATKAFPLGAIYLLDEREVGLQAPIVEEVAGSDALAGLVANTYVNYLLDRDMRSSEFDLLGRLVTKTPVRRVRPLAEPAAVFDLCEIIAADAKRVMISNAATSTAKDDISDV